MKVTKTWVLVALMTIVSLGFAQGNMNIDEFGTMATENSQALHKNWTILPNGDKVRCNYNASYNTHITSSAGWDITLPGTAYPSITQESGTISCLVNQYDDAVIGDSTYANPPDGKEYSILIKISSVGTILSSSRAIGDAIPKAMAVSNSRTFFAGDGGLSIEHISSPFGGAFVLAHDGTDWDVTAGFFIERPADGTSPSITSIQCLPNGNLAIAGYTDGGNSINIGGIIVPSYGGKDGFRAEITPEGVGISVVQFASTGDDDQILQWTNPDGSFVVSGIFHSAITFYNANGSAGTTLPINGGYDQAFFAFYSADGTFIRVEYAYANKHLRNVALDGNSNFFYALIDNNEDGSVMETSLGTTHSNLAPVLFKFDTMGVPVWSKQYESIGGSITAQVGDELLVQEDGTILIAGLEYGKSDLDFNAGVVELNGVTSFWATYDDAMPVAPVSAFSGVPTSITQGETVYFTDESIAGTSAITSWHWSFGNGATSTLQNPSYTYISSGLFRITLIVSDGTLSDTLSVDNYVNVDVQAFDISPTTITVPFDAESTQVTITTTGPWTVVDNSSKLESSETSGSGNTDVTVFILDKSKTWTDSIAYVATYSGETIYFVVTQENAALTGEISVLPGGDISLGTEITLSAQGLGGSGSYTYAWTSDPAGFTSTEQSPVTSPTENTTYFCTVDDGANNVVLDVPVTVHPLPEIDFTSDSFEADSAKVVNFTANVTYPPDAFSVDAWLWDFHDPDGVNGGISTEENPSYAFHLVGIHDVSLTVTLTDGTVIEELKVGYITIKTGIEENSNLPTETKLHQNYPNPFNPTTTIRFEAPRDVEITKLVIYNSGGEVVEIIKGNRSFGSQTFNIIANNWSSGTHFAQALYRKSNGKNEEMHTQIVKMLFVK